MAMLLSVNVTGGRSRMSQPPVEPLRSLIFSDKSSKKSFPRIIEIRLNRSVSMEFR